MRPKSARRPRTAVLDPVAPGAPPAVAPAAAEAPPAAPRVRYRRPRLTPSGIDPRLVFFLAPDAPAAEQYRHLAAELVRDPKPPRRLWVVGAAPRVGASLTAANLGAALAEFGRVTLVDTLPAGAPGAAPTRLAALFGLGAPPADGGPAPGDAAHLDLWLVSERLALQAATPLLPLTPERATVFGAVAAAADYVLIDGPAVDDPAAVEAMRQVVDGALLVIRPADLGTGRYERALDRLKGLRIVGVTVNGAADDLLHG